MQGSEKTLLKDININDTSSGEYAKRLMQSATAF